MKINKNISRRKKIVLAVAIVLFSVSLILTIYTSSSSRLLDKSEYRKLYKSIIETEEDGGFTSQKSLRNFILKWADDKKLSYEVDENNNIIFSSKAISRKKKVSPTVLCVDYNYETASDDARVLASAAMTAATELSSGKRDVIFFENGKNEAKGYRGIDKKYFTDQTKAIYLDSGSPYISTESYAQELSTIQIPVEREPVKCDTAIRIKISGITPKIVNTNITKLPSPIIAWRQILTRLKEKSTISQIADFKIEGHGLMNPVSLDATILLNSYSVEGLTSYIDKRIESWEEAYSENNEGLSFTYEVIENVDDTSIETAYSQKTFKKLTNVLYTVNEGNYKFEEGDTLPEGKEIGDNYGVNAMVGLRSDDNNIYLDLMSQGYDSKHLDKITADNKAASELFGCKYKTNEITPNFVNKKDALARNITLTYLKVNDNYGENIILPTDTDRYFTPCSYLQEINGNMDIIHLRMNSSTAVVITNTILGYIEKKGNFLSI